MRSKAARDCASLVSAGRGSIGVRTRFVSTGTTDKRAGTSLALPGMKKARVSMSKARARLNLARTRRERSDVAFPRRNARR
jgi:hypothetical protein